MILNIIHNDCDPSIAKSKELPLNSYLVTYISEDKIKYDIVQSNSEVKIFEAYYDKYREVRGIVWTSGIINPKLWNYQAQNPNVNKKKR